MRCPACADILEPGASHCPTCGVSVATVSAFSSPVRMCPRCGYNGQGTRHFSRLGHVGILVALSLFTYGLGGLAYWLARRSHLICPRCGFGWGNASRLLPPSQDLRGTRLGSGSPVPAGGSLPSGGGKRRFLGVLGILVACVLIVVGIASFEPAALAIGSVAGALGSGVFVWGTKGREARRQALLEGLQRRVLVLATRRSGSLTVTEVAAELSLSIPGAEKVLMGMEDGFRVRSEITDEGLLVYEFPEVQHRPRLDRGSAFD